MTICNYFSRFKVVFKVSNKNLSPLFFMRSKVILFSNIFSKGVTHRKFSTRLSLLIVFMWSTSDLFSVFGIKALATKRCTPIFLPL